MAKSSREVTRCGVAALPMDLWCAVAQYNGVAECGVALQSCSWLREVFNLEAVWRNLAVCSGIARVAAGPDAAWLFSFGPPLLVDHFVDWRGLVQAKVRGRRASFVWVRIQDIDLRIMLPKGVPGTAGAILAEVRRLVRVCDALRAALQAGDAAAGRSGDLCNAPHLPRRFVGEHPIESLDWALRLRRLQWAGRPGPALEVHSPIAAGHLLLEWALPALELWPLPSRALSQAAPRNTLGGEEVVRRRGDDPAAPRALDLDGAVPMLHLRVLTMLLPQELWLAVPMTSTLRALFQEIAKVLREKSPLLAELRQPIELSLMEPRRPKWKARVPDWKTLRALFWAQSETVRVELEGSVAPPTGRSAGGHRLSAAGSPAGSGSSAPVSLLIWREQAFSESSAFPLDRMGGCPAVARGLSSTASATWSRQVSDPSPLLVADTPQQAAEPLTLPPEWWGRQSSEPPPVRQAWTRETQEPQPWPQTPSHCSQTPDSAAAEGAADATGLLQPSGSSHGKPSEASEATGAVIALERLVPHYAPRLLPRTLRTRQFEFHPTLPDMILTGDKKGSVNVLDVESELVHPPLVVSSCPVLGLAWLRHNPQIAVCGASHSGKIMFLKYEPEARMMEPSLRKLSSVEEFPKLSSLSANCTDDFLLASGISPNIAVYDVQTGKALLRANGVHEHFINISRFCNNSPHIFATASFDHTCKVWDLRQPLAHDRPVKTLNTGGHNVMCVFSPDDRYVLCSGVDTRIKQYEVPSWRQTPEHFPMRKPVHRERYRRSTYLANSRHFVTAATEESHMHLLSVDGRKLGAVDFRGVVQAWNTKTSDELSFLLNPNCLQARNGSMLPQSSSAASEQWARSWRRCSANTSFLSSPNWAAGGAQPKAPRYQDLEPPTAQLRRGSVQLDDADPNGGSSRNNHEFVQSIRTHPAITHRVGVLLSLTQGSSGQEELSYVALVDLDRRVVER